MWRLGLGSSLRLTLSAGAKVLNPSLGYSAEISALKIDN
jgi:hypothetical protein